MRRSYLSGTNHVAVAQIKTFAVSFVFSPVRIERRNQAPSKSLIFSDRHLIGIKSQIECARRRAAGGSDEKAREHNTFFYGW